MAYLVMGRAAVMVTATALGLVGMAQLFGITVSTSLQRAGGAPVDVLWSLCLICGWAFVAASLIAARHEDDAAMVLERAGAILLMVGIVVVAVAVIKSSGWEGSIFVLALCSSTILNLAGRQILLARAAKTLVLQARADR